MEEQKAKPRLMAPPDQRQQERSLILGMSMIGGLLASPIKIIQFIIMYWKPLLIGGLLATVLYQNFSPTRFVLWVDTIPYLQNKIVELEEEKEEVYAANTLLQQKITKTNATVLEWKQKTNLLQERLEILSESLIQQQEDVAEEVAEILNGETPPDCEASIEYLIEGVETLQWDTK